MGWTCLAIYVSYVYVANTFRPVPHIFEYLLARGRTQDTKLTINYTMYQAEGARVGSSYLLPYALRQQDFNLT